jgi:hypothetical protein
VKRRLEKDEAARAMIDELPVQGRATPTASDEKTSEAKKAREARGSARMPDSHRAVTGWSPDGGRGRACQARSHPGKHAIPFRLEIAFQVLCVIVVMLAIILPFVTWQVTNLAEFPDNEGQGKQDKGGEKFGAHGLLAMWRRQQHPLTAHPKVMTASWLLNRRMRRIGRRHYLTSAFQRRHTG